MCICIHSALKCQDVTNPYGFAGCSVAGGVYKAMNIFFDKGHITTRDFQKTMLLSCIESW